MTGRIPLSLAPVGIAGLFVLVGSLVSANFAQETIAGLTQGAIFANLALALVLVERSSGLLNIAQGEMAMATTYFAFQFTQWGMGYWPAFLLTLAVAFVFGAAVQSVLIRPVQHRPPSTVVVVTIGLFILIDGLVTWRWGAEIQFLRAPFGNAVYNVGSVAIARQTLGTLLVSIAAVVALWLFFRFTKLGFGMRAVSERRDAAELMGVPVNRMLAIGWGLAAVLGAVAGLMAAPTQFLQPTMMHSILMYALAAAVFGGFDSPSGAVIGGLTLGVFLNLAGAYVSFVTPELRLPAAFVVLVAVLLVKPSGLLGSEKVQRA